MLKQLLAIQTHYGEESAVVEFLLEYAKQHGIRAWHDTSGNVYFVKGTLRECEVYPCVCAHTDSVHRLLPSPITIKDQDGLLYALDSRGNPTGCGGDDKAGVFICLELFERCDILKGAFFVSEEIGCVGSRRSDLSFFQDVGYVLEFDSPCEDIMTYTCDGTQLFEDNGLFIRLAQPVLETHGVTDWQHHPYTDVSILKRRHPFSCMNLPAGYFRMHTAYEYVSVEAVHNSINLGDALLRVLGNNLYRYTYDDRGRRPLHEIRFLHVHDYKKPSTLNGLPARSVQTAR